MVGLDGGEPKPVLPGSLTVWTDDLRGFPRPGGRGAARPGGGPLAVGGRSEETNG